MKDETLDDGNQKTTLVVRSKDLVISEIIVFLSISFFFIYLMNEHGAYVFFEGIGMFITPLLYAIIWRYKSIKYDKSLKKEELQSEITVLTSILGLLQNIALILLGIGGITDDIFLGVSSLIFGVSSSFYIVKSFRKSYRIDHKK